MRNIVFTNNEYYHVYNRGVEKRDIFSSEEDCDRFLLSLKLLNDEQGDLMIRWRDFCKKDKKNTNTADFLMLNLKSPLVEIVAYCLNPNHYHLILKQITNRGIERFMHKLGTSYTKYFNLKNNHSGVLFQGTFKSIYIDSNKYLLYLSAYVNRNYYIHGFGDDSCWKYSSMWDYTGKRKDGLCNAQIILEQFNYDFAAYAALLDDTGLYIKNKKNLEKYLIE